MQQRRRQGRGHVDAAHGLLHPRRTCPSRIRCQAATGSWTKSRQWEAERTLFSSARATHVSAGEGQHVWPFNDAWLRTSLSQRRSSTTPSRFWEPCRRTRSSEPSSCLLRRPARHEGQSFDSGHALRAVPRNLLHGLFLVWILVILLAVVPWIQCQNHAHWARVGWIPSVSGPVLLGDILQNTLLYLPFGYLHARQRSRSPLPRSIAPVSH